MHPVDAIAAYYRSPSVRARVAEYARGALALGGYGGRRGLHEPDGAPVRADSADPQALFDDGADVCRSMADRGGALVQLDVDYANPSDGAEPYREPDACFERLEPVHAEIRRAFAAHGLAPLCLLTGRGYHFTLRAPRGTALYRDLVASGAPPDPLQARYRARCAAGDLDALERGFAHDGAGRLLEHLAHGVLARLRGRTDVPVTLADVPPPGRGPFICLDLSAYADPLDVRYCRCAFSANQKPAVADGPDPRRAFPLVLPRRGGLASVLRARGDAVEAARLAAEEHTEIPDFGEAPGWRRAYEGGPLGRFHRAFDRGPQVPTDEWAYTYDSLDLRALPACASQPLARANPLLLVPTYLRSVALALWGLGWHPRSVAGLICSRYHQQLGWQGLWERYEPSARAEFYVRVFCGLAACGLDDADGFNCETQAARGGCPWPRCGHDLRALFASRAIASGGAA